MSRNQPQRQLQRQPQKPPRRKIRTEVYFGFVFLLIGVYLIGYFYNQRAVGEIEQTQVVMGYVDAPPVFSGIIVRDEVVYRAQRYGGLVFHVEHSQRVRAGQAVASVRDGVAYDYIENITEIEQKAIENARINPVSNQSDIDDQNHHILSIIDSMAFSGSANALQDLGRLTAEEMNRRNNLYFVGASGLAQDRQAAEGNLGNVISQMYAQSSGIVSVYLDGLEETLSPAGLTNISSGMIESIASFAAGTNTASAAGPNIGAGQAAFRIVRSNDWFIAAYMPETYARGLIVNSSITIFVEQSDGLLPLVVEVNRLSDRGAYYYVVFRTNFETLRFIDQRNIAFQLQENPMPGYLVPRSALAERSVFPVPRGFVRERYGMMTAYKAVSDGDSVSLSLVTVSGWVCPEETTFFVMADGSGLRAGDILVNDEEEFALDYIMPVLGVFVTNRGHTVFRQIHLAEDYVFSGDYVILEPKENPHIRLFDWIVKSAEDAQNRLLLN
jgi:hypothetical protein